VGKGIDKVRELIKICCITAAQDFQKGSGIEEQAMPIDLG
jgi:hypothetical protein